MMLLVIDVAKGIQTQTAECLIIGEISYDRMMIVLNKIDLIPPEERQLKKREGM
jgi:selenocysteine-specific elongation factor